MTPQQSITFYNHNPLYEPIPYITPQTSLALRTSHGTQGKIRLHNAQDSINQNLGLESIIVSYQINGSFNPLYTLADFIRTPQLFHPDSGGSLQGDLGERIARRVSKYALQHFTRGNTDGMFGEDFDPNREYVVAHTERFVLKIHHYPNMIILKKGEQNDSRAVEKDEKFGYVTIKEIDGLIAYRVGSQRHIIMLESKTNKTKLDIRHIREHLIRPMKQLFPQVALSYLLFAPVEQIFDPSSMETHRGLNKEATELYHNLMQEGVSSIFYTFRESASDFSHVIDHLQMSYALFERQPSTITGRTVLTAGGLEIFGRSSQPVLTLRLGEDGAYHIT